MFTNAIAISVISISTAIASIGAAGDIVPAMCRDAITGVPVGALQPDRSSVGEVITEEIRGTGLAALGGALGVIGGAIEIA